MFPLQKIIITLTFTALLADCQLYTSNDSVSIFKPDSFHSIFNDKPTDNWFIEFYHSYCGHCINFAPMFKTFLKEAKHWSSVIRFGVVDCSQHKDLCNEQAVNFYPFFKIYVKRSLNNSSSTGQMVSVSHNTINELYGGVIETIEHYLKPQQLIETRPGDIIKDSLHFLVSGANKVDLKRIMLTFTGRLQYPIYYSFQGGSSDYGVELVNGTFSFSGRYANVDDLNSYLSKYLIDHSETKVFTPPDIAVTTPIYKPDSARSSTVPAVYNQDIYSSIYYAFTNDISDAVLTNVGSVIILKNFVQQLYMYSDIGDTFTANFKHLLTLLEKKIEAMQGRSKIVMKWKDMLRQSRFPEIEPSWIGCNGSLPHLRRYPCGLWTMFHTLTVNLHVKVTSKAVDKDGSLELIRSIREFIFTFFACRECADNFKKETLDYETRVVDSNRAVLYLWQVHNSVNKRLSKAPSEDPMAPKISFPSEFACPSCRLTKNATWPRLIQWSYPDVLTFLVRHYSNINRVHFLSQPVLMLRTSSWFLLGPSSMDMQICVVLSVFCLAIVILAFVKFWLRSSFCSLRKYQRTALIS